MENLLIGKVIDSFGLDGTLKILSSTYFAEKRYQKGNVISLIRKDGTIEKLTVVSFRKNKDLNFVKFEEINTKEEALERKGCELQVPKDDSVLSKGEYYFVDLEGCDVYDSESRLLGKVKIVEEFPSTICLRVVRDNASDFFVPFRKEFIINVDIANKKIIINVIEGML